MFYINLLTSKYRICFFRQQSVLEIESCLLNFTTCISAQAKSVIISVQFSKTKYHKTERSSPVFPYLRTQVEIYSSSSRNI